jgi:acetoin utilization deacetylase AcuC-like enzyme
MRIYYSHAHRLHAPAWYLADGTVRPCPDNPGRLDTLLEALHALPNAQLLTADHIDPFPALRAIHTADYLDYLRTIHPLWIAEFGHEGSAAVLPDTFPRRMPGTKRPTKPSAQAGYYCFDMAAPITADTYDAVVAGARCAVAAAGAILDGSLPPHQRWAYAACRPPGHHAGPDYCGGFCYLNNAAAAAQHLLLAGLKKVAILDIDYHQGNGTQDIFYERDDVFFVSIHADPNTQYPYFWGQADERGSAAGEGATRNYPLPRGASEAQWLAVFGRAAANVAAWGPEALVVSLGVDTSVNDTVGDFQLTRAGFEEIGRGLARMRLPTVFVQEGGYNLEDIGGAVAAVLGAYGAHVV